MIAEVAGLGWGNAELDEKVVLNALSVTVAEAFNAWLPNLPIDISL